MNVTQEQNSLIVGGNVQDGVPTQQSDPTLIQNSHYLPNGDLTLAADQDLDTWTTKVVTLPITAVAALFQVETDSSEPNLVVDNEIDYTPSKYTPHLQTSMPNIAHYIGMIITGADIDQRYQESILICTAGYLDGIMEILANGTFMYLNQRRDGLTRRYSQLCMLINYSISTMLYPPALPNAEVAMEQQAIIQMLYLEGATSILVQIKPAIVGNESYTVTKAMLNRWAMTTPWHALMYNSQAPLKMRQFIVLFNNIYAMNCGKRLSYENSFVGKQPTLAILPNFDLYVKLTPPGMRSSTYNINSKIPQRFIMFARYLLYTEDNVLEWDDGTEDDYLTDDESVISELSEAEGPDEGLAY